MGIVSAIINIQNPMAIRVKTVKKIPLNARKQILK
jgi:hypothetical protein